MKTIRLVFIATLIIFLGCKQNKEDKIQIGVILPLSGSMANYGKSIKGALNAMEYVLNEERVKKGYPKLELIFEDNKLEVKEGINAINKLIKNDKVSSIIGPFSSSITLGVAPITEKNKTVLITPGSTSSDITNAGEYIFRTILSGEYEAEITASVYKKDFINSKLAIMYLNNEYGVSLKNNFIKHINTNNYIEIPYDENETNFNSLFSKIRSNNCKVIYLIGYNEMINVFHQAKQQGIDVGWLGTAQLASQTFIDKIGSAAEGTILPTWKLDINEIKNKNNSFYKKFLEFSDNSELDAFAANSVDALLVLNYVYGANYKKTGTEIRDELYNIKEFTGITGVFSFDSNGDVIKEMGVKIIEKGELVDYKP